MKHILITGANRGIGLAFCRIYLHRGDHVFATCRLPDKANELHKLKEIYKDSLEILEMDVNDEKSIRKTRNKIPCLDILINNAGCFVANEEGVESVDMEKMLDVYRVNAVAPLIMTKHFLSLLTQSENPLIANLVSGVGVMRELTPERVSQYSYGSSKAALNMATSLMAKELRNDGVIVIGLSPGFVKTDMTKDSEIIPPLQPDESARGMIDVIDGLKIKNSGGFFLWNGEKQDWYLA